MNTLALILFWVLVGLWLLQMIPTLGFLFILGRRKRQHRSDEAYPKTAVILSLRGTDPFLSESLKRLFTQDYPHYEVHIVVDAPNDPARSTVDELISQLQVTHVHVEPLHNRLETCSLKISSLLQAVGQLDESFEVIAFMDADAMPNKDWLKDLVTPLLEEKVGAVTGQRWYMPDRPSLASLVRFIWNSYNVVATATNSIWGGTYALKRRLLHETGLLDVWPKAISDDGIVYSPLRKAGYHIEFVPDLLIVNRESCTLSDIFRWLSRQILMGRLYHFAWPLMLLHGFLMTLILMGTVGLIGVATVSDGDVATWTLGGLAIYITGMLLGIMLLELAARRIIRRRGEATSWITLPAVAWFVLAVPLTQVIYTAALFKAAMIRQVEWRGVTYNIRGPWDIQLVEYRPFAASDDSQSAIASI